MGNLNSSSLFLWAAGAFFVLFIAVLAIMDARKKANQFRLEALAANRSLQELRETLAALEATAKEYRTAAGKLVHGKEFKTDTDALSAIERAAADDLAILEEFIAITPEIRKSLDAHNRVKGNKPIHGLRAAKDWVLTLCSDAEMLTSISAQEAREAERINTVMIDAAATLSLQLHATLERETIAHSHAVSVVKSAKTIVDNA